MTNSNPQLQPIQNGVSYPLSVFQKMTGLGKQALRKARLSGLRVWRVGGRAFVLGDDFNEFLVSHTDEHDPEDD